MIGLQRLLLLAVALAAGAGLITGCASEPTPPPPTASAPDYEAFGGAMEEQHAEDFVPPASVPYANGRIPDRYLAPIYRGRLLKPYAARWNALNVVVFRLYGFRLAPLGPASSYRTLAQQVALFRGCRPGWCARPGNSNHGWGTTIDLQDGGRGSMRRAIDRHGRAFGFSKRCSDAQHEAWHIKGDWACNGASATPPPDPGPLGDRACRGARVRGKCRPILKKGIRGRFRAVKLVQRTLDGECIPTPNHGKYTQRTRVSIKRFQRRNRQHADGIVGKRTWQALERHRRHHHRCGR